MTQKKLITAGAATVLMVSFALMPGAAFAKDNGHNGWGNGFMRNVASFFGAKKAEAQTQGNRAPSISGISSPTVLSVDEEGTWTVRASDPENGTLEYSVDWNDTMNANARSASAGFTQDATFTHSYSAAGTYKPTFTVRDEDGRTSKTSVTVRVGEFGQGENLKIHKVEADPSETGAVITWKTNRNSDSTVYFGTGSPLATSSAESETGAGDTKNHSVTLEGLSPGTTYYYVISSSNGSKTKESAEYSFTTDKEGNGGELMINSFDGPDTLDVDEEGTWTVTATDPENDQLSYSISWGDEGMLSRMFSFMKPFTQESTFTHTYAAEGTYTITVTVKDGNGNEDTETTTVTVDEDDGNMGTDPVLSGLTALVDNDRVTFTWTTDVETDATVYYSSTGTATPGDAGTTEQADATMTTNHSATVTGLSAGTSYSFLIASEDAEGDDATTAAFTLTTMTF